MKIVFLRPLGLRLKFEKLLTIKKTFGIINRSYGEMAELV